ncbi:VOC family protein [Flexivirga sp. B27]
MGQPIVYFEIEGRDGQALQSFYSELFGWAVNADNPGNYGVIQRQDRSVGIDGAVFGVPEVPSSTWRGPTRAEGYAGGVTAFVQVPDVEAALTRAEALGGTRMQGPDDAPGGMTMGKFTDPEGRLIGVVGPPPSQGS